MEKSLFGITARPRNVPVETSSLLSTKSILPSRDGLVSPVSATCTGLGVSRELGRLQRLTTLIDNRVRDRLGLIQCKRSVELAPAELRLGARVRELAVGLLGNRLKRTGIDHV